MSRSPIVSARRRRLPQTSARITCGMVAHRLEDRSDQPKRIALEDPLAGLLDKGDPLEDLGLGLGAKALELGDLARLAGRAQVGQALDLERLVQRLDLLGAQARECARARPGPAACSAAARRKRADCPVVASCTILAYIVSPMPGTSFKRPSAIISGRSPGRFDQRLGRRVIRATRGTGSPPELEQRPHLVDDLSDSWRFPSRVPRIATTLHRAVEPCPAATADSQTGSHRANSSAAFWSNWPSSIRSASTRARILRTRCALAKDHSTQ